MNEKQDIAYFFADSTLAKTKQDTVTAKPVANQDSVREKPTFAQIRYWRWLREKKLLIGNSRYIQAKDDVKLVSSDVKGKNQLGLPVYVKNEFNTDWLTVVIILSLVLLASVRISYAKYIEALFQSLVNYSTAFRMFRERNYSFTHGAVRLELFFYIVFSIFLFQLFNYFQVEIAKPTLLFFLKCTALVCVYFFIKKMMYQVLGSVFERTSETAEYLFNMDNFNRVLGIILLPLIALINYYPSGTPAFVVLLAIISGLVFYAFLLYRGISNLLKKQYPKFYLFLYLCTLEFLPLLLIYKVVVL